MTITVSSSQSKALAESQPGSLQERCQSIRHQRPGTTDLSSDMEALAMQESPTTQFLIHKNLLCQRSCFFTAAFNGNFMEGATQSMVLDDVDADTFGVVVNWIYTQRISDASNGVPSLCESLIFLKTRSLYFQIYRKSTTSSKQVLSYQRI